MPIRPSRRASPPRPERPRNCVRIYPVMGGYFIVAYDAAGEAIGECRATAKNWERALEGMETFRQQETGTHLKLSHG